VYATRLLSLVFVFPILGTIAGAQSEPANYDLARKFDDSFVRQFVHSTSVRPNWIGKTDRFWYSYKTPTGQHCWLVDCEKRTKRPLFDHDELAAKLSLALKTPIDAPLLTLGSAKVDDEGKKLTFSFMKKQFEYDLANNKLTEKGKPPAPPAMDPRLAERLRQLGRTVKGPVKKEKPWSHRNFSPDRTAYAFVRGYDLYLVEAPRKVRDAIKKMTEEMEKEKKAKEEAEKKGGGKSDTEKKTQKKKDTKKVDQGKKKTVEKKGGKKKAGDQKKKDGKQQAKDKKKEPVEDDRDKREKWADKVNEDKALRLSRDGEEFYSFGPTSFRRNLEDKKKFDPKKKYRASVTWSKDSSTFYAMRQDSRGVKELFLVNSLAKPRPKLERYQYAMPGEEKIRRSDLFFYHRRSRKLRKVAMKWKQESYLNVHWRPESHELRFVRRDRPRRKLELVKVDVTTGKETPLIEDEFEVGLIGEQPVRYLEKRKQMIWWSERSGWGHYYLYGIDGKFENPITWGTFRSNRIVKVDEDKGILYFRGSGREKRDAHSKENLYYQHLYRIYLDGTGLTLMDPGNATHTSALSPSNRFVVDNFNRVDLAPQSVLRDANGNQLIRLEETDLSALYATGWKMPETFVVKAADGVTDLFGNMWKPFDFNPKKKYPIIVNVYPGPQQEGVTHTFSATAGGRQQLAQLGFIVIQVGHRGGAPGRSKAYQNYSYGNMRDYALEDKKVAIEKLAATHPFIDIDRVGIYGHSGGGFFTATAMLKPPYNKFFKVGVASSGNHDNNIYNNSWAERYHGLKEVEVKEKEKAKAKSAGKKTGGKKTGGKKTGGKKTGKGKITAAQGKKGKKGKDDDKKKSEKKKTRFEIHIPTTWELAANLEGKLLLVHGDMDNNVHPAGTMRLVDALIKAKKRFDMLIIPGARHGYGAAREYFKQRMWEYFAEHLLGDYQPGADIMEKTGRKR